jgi:hypothetical protein
VEGVNPADLTALLNAAGPALYGRDWKTELAEALQVDRRTVARWSAGTFDMPPGALVDLWNLCKERQAELAGIVEAAEPLVVKLVREAERAAKAAERAAKAAAKAAKA